MGPRWRVDERWGATARLHSDSVALIVPGTEAAAGPVARVLTSTDRAVVLGSGQPEDHVDRERAGASGIEVVRRRSGGGAVMVGPGLVVWIDVVVPAGDDLWERDVGQAAWWLGEVWTAALADVGMPGGEVWRGAQRRTCWSDRVCFAGLGAGEVSVGGRKVVGISQRRTRSGALFQCAVPIAWEPAALLDVLRLTPEQRRQAGADISTAATGIGHGREGSLAAAFVDALPP